MKKQYLIAFPTLCQGEGYTTIDNDQTGEPEPCLFNSREEAMLDIFEDCLYSLQNRTPEELSEYNPDVTLELILKMEEVLNSGDIQEMERFLTAFPQCNDGDYYVVEASQAKV